MAISADSDDPTRDFSEGEKSALTRNLLRLTQYVNGLAETEEYDLEFVRRLHHQLFHDIRDHAGRIRNRDYGESFLNFGPNRSAEAIEVPERLKEHFLLAHKLFRQLDGLKDDLRFVEQVIKAAVYIHAEFIKIHPFRDGNGRVSRLVMSFVLRKYGLPLVPLNVPRQEYIDCLNHYYKTKELDPLVDLLIRIYYNEFVR